MLTTGYHSFQISIIVFHLRCEAVWGDKFVKDCWVVTCDRKVQDRGTRGKWPWKEKGQDNWAHTLSLCSPRRPQPPPALHGHVPFSNGPCDQRGISSSPSLAAATSVYQVNWREGRRSCCSFSSTGSWLGHNGATCCVSYVCLCSSILSCPSSPRYTLTHMVPSPELAGHRTLTQQQVPGCGRNLSSDQLWTRGPTARAEKMLQRRGRVKNLKGGQCPCLPCHGTKGEGEGGRDRLRHTRKTEPGSGGLIQCQAWKPRSIFRLTVSETGWEGMILM